jgi:hypothetical protein
MKPMLAGIATTAILAGRRLSFGAKAWPPV